MGKKPQLSPREKKLLQEEKKIAKKLAIAEGKRQVKRDQLSREIKYGELTRKLIQEKWKEMMKDLTLPQLQIEFQLAVNNTDLILDLKDFQISLLLDELDQAEDQYAYNLKSHCEDMENLYNIYLLRLRTLKTEYDEELNFMIKEIGLESEQIMEKSEDASTYTKTMVFQLACEEKDLVNMGRATYMSKQKETEQKNTDELNLRRKKEEDKFENIWKKYVDHLENYNVQISEMKKDYDERMEKDKIMVDIIRKQSKGLLHLHNVLKITKEQQEIQKDNVSKKMMDLNNEIEYYNKIFLTLKKTYEHEVKYDKNILTQLVIQSNDSIKILKNIEVLVQKILQMHSLNRKFETKHEQILPFPKSLPRKIKGVVDESKFKDLEHFWAKCAIADAGRNKVSDEYMHELEENHSLKHAIKSCIEYSCNKKLPPITPVIATRLRSERVNNFYKL